MSILEGQIVVVKFFNDSYLYFIEYCLKNVLISGVHIQINGKFGIDPAITAPDFVYTLFLFVAAPGVDRLEKAIQDFGGK